MSTREQVQTTSAIAIRAFFSDAHGQEDRLHECLTKGDGDQDIAEFLSEHGFDNISPWQPLEDKDVDYLRDAVDNLAMDILATMT